MRPFPTLLAVEHARSQAPACLLTFSLIVAIAGCSGEKKANDAAQTMTKPEPTKPKVALIMKSLANEFFATMADGAATHQAAHADEYDLVVNGIKDERDLSRQVGIVEEMIAAGANAIVIAPADSKALVPVLRRAKAAGLVVINIDNRLDAEIQVMRSQAHQSEGISCL